MGRLFKIKAFLALIVAGCLGLVFGGKVSASVMSMDSLQRLAITRGVRTCYDVAAVSEIKQNYFESYKSLFTDSRGGYLPEAKNVSIYLPTQEWSNTPELQNTVSPIKKCEDVFEGKNYSFSNYYNIPTSLEGLGYVFDHNDTSYESGVSGTADADEDMVTITLKSIVNNDNNDKTPISVVSGKDSITCKGNQIEKKTGALWWSGIKSYWDVEYCSGEITAYYPGDNLSDSGILFQVKVDGKDSYSFSINSGKAEVWDHLMTAYSLDKIGLDDSLNTLFDNISSDKSENRRPFEQVINNSKFFERLKEYFRVSAQAFYYDPSASFAVSSSAPNTSDSGSTESVYKPFNNDKKDAADKMLSGVVSDANLPFMNRTVKGTKLTNYYWSPSARYSLYYNYLLKAVNKYPGININNCESSVPSSKYHYKDASNRWCQINIPASISEGTLENDPVAVIRNGKSELESGSVLEVFRWLSDGYSYNGLTEGEYANGINPDSPSGNEDGGSDSSEDCYSTEGLNGMAWVLCPALYNLEGAAVGISGWIDDLLVVDEDLYSSEGDVYEVWGFMQGIANTLLIIVLVVVIFSQLTGYGIDNYGIKKILPKLVVVAVLINLSFLLCQLLIDLSNIMGNGLNNLLGGLGKESGLSYGEIISGIVTGLLTGTAALGASSSLVISIVLTVSSGGSAAVVIVLILTLITILVGVLMFFLMLGARLIIISLFTILAPVAIACYILPNTQKYYKNWWKVFSTALVMYPLCGALYGISRIIKGFVFDGTGDIHPVMALVAVLAPVLPYYVLPTLLKNTMSGLGAAGSFFNSLGSSLRKGISEGKSTIQSTGAYKSGTEMSQRNMNMLRAGYRRDRKTGEIKPVKVSAVGKVFRGGNIGMANAKAAMLRDIEKNQAEYNLASDETVQAKIGEIASKQADIDAKSYETQLRSGKVAGVNADNSSSVAENLSGLLKQYHNETNASERSRIMSKIRGAQAILAESKPGRDEVQKAYETAIKENYDSALYGGTGAAHYFKQSAGASLGKVRSMDEMVTDLTAGIDGATLNENISNNYIKKALSKYNAETFANADKFEHGRVLSNLDKIITKRNANGELVPDNDARQHLLNLINTAETSDTIHVTGQTQEIFDEIKNRLGVSFKIDHSTVGSALNNETASVNPAPVNNAGGSSTEGNKTEFRRTDKFTGPNNGSGVM